MFAMNQNLKGKKSLKVSDQTKLLLQDFDQVLKGQIKHTHSVKHARGYEDKTVVVVGIGNSATDCAVELATVTKQV